MKNLFLFWRLSFTVLLMALGFVTAQAQQKVTGLVTDPAGEPIIGANVLEKGSTNGVITDFDGNFTLNVKNGATLVISYVGYVTQEVKAASQVKVVLAEDSEILEDLVVIGYGVQKKSSLTGAISSVRSEDMQNRTISNVEDALQGKTAGVQLISANASPGAAPTIRVRGYSSNATSDPLYVVDGIRLKNISGIDPNDIESMEVLKDAASAAIYGAEAGNGVVLITTKKGKTGGDAKISYSFQHTAQSVTKMPKVLNAKQYAEYMTEGGLLPESFIKENWDGKTDTNWADEVFESGKIQKHSLSFSKGNEGGTYYASLSYYDNDGIFLGDKDTYKRLSGSINAEQKIKNWLTIGTTVNIDKNQRKGISSNSFQNNAMSAVLQMDPLTPVYYTAENLPQHMLLAIDNGYTLATDGDGKYWSSSVFDQSDNINPLIQRDNNYNLTKGFDISGSAYANFTPIKGFVFTTRLGYQYSMSEYTSTSLPYYGNATQANKFVGLSSNINTQRYYQWENFANYSTSFGDHSISAMAGVSFLERGRNNVNGQLTANGEDAIQKNDPTFWYLNYKNASATQGVGGEDTYNTQYSYFGRISYDYAGKYMLQASLRADAADLSYLSKDNRWGYFPAVSLGWTVSKESFFEPLKNSVDDLKLRASWGQNGSLSALGGYSYGTSITNGGFYPLDGQNWFVVSYPTSLGNNDLKWETSEQIDLGIDARFFNSKLTVSVDWFNKMTKDLLIWGTKPSYSVGGPMSPLNAGNVSNKGFEFEVGWKDNIGDFSYSVKGNLSTLKNKVTYLDKSLPRVEGTGLGAVYPVTYFEEGLPIYYFRGYKFAGVDPATGDPTFEDVNGDGIINENDKTNIGNGIPTMNFGITLTAAYKGFDLVVFGQGATGNDIFSGTTKINFPKSNRLAEIWYNDRWTPSNTTGSVPRANCNDSEKYALSDAMVYDGSYFKIKQIQLGYSLPKNLIKKIGMTNLRVYASLDDFFTFTKYIGFDPEISSNATSGMGLDLGGYPSSKKLVFGINLDF